MNLAEFLLARIAEDEEKYNAEAREKLGPSLGSGPWLHLPRPLAECEAKRRVVELAEEAQSIDEMHWNDRGLPSDPGWDQPRVGERILRALALPYAEHPDYRDEWRPADPMPRGQYGPTADYGEG